MKSKCISGYHGMHFKPEFNSPLFNGAQMTFRSLEVLQRLGEQNVSFMGQMKLLILPGSHNAHCLSTFLEI